MQNRPDRPLPLRSDTLSAALGRAFLRWLGLPGLAAPVIPAGPPAVATPQQPAAAAPAATRPVIARGSAVATPAAPQTPGAGLVAGLVADPRSLAAGFIVAEILGPPVALRRP